MKTTNFDRRSGYRQWVASIVMALVMVVMLYPFWMITRSSLSASSDGNITQAITLASWHTLFATLPIIQQLLNSTMVTLGAITVIILASSMAGFALAHLGNRKSHYLFLAIVGSMLIPMPSIIVTEFANIAKLGLVNHISGAILVYSALGLPFAVFLMYTYYKDMPRELLEAALVDGMSYKQAYLRIALPLSVPAILAVGALQFIQIWDDLLVALLLLQTPTHRTITVGLAVLQSGHFLNIPVLMAGSLLSALPAAVVYLIFQRHLIGGLMLGIGK